MITKLFVETSHVANDKLISQLCVHMYDYFNAERENDPVGWLRMLLARQNTLRVGITHGTNLSHIQNTSIPTVYIMDGLQSVIYK